MDETKQSEYVLSVCIPTYNRRSDLESAVKSVLAIYRPEIEILISDNCSSDETEQFCRSLTDAYPFVRYMRNEENIGPDGNFLQLFQSANGKYIQILSDDDEVRCDDIDGFLGFLRNNDFSVGEMYSVSKFAVVPPENKTEKIYSASDVCSFVREHGINLTFVSALLFNREIFRQIESPDQYKNTSLLQTHLVAAMLRNNKTADIFEYYVAATPNLSGGYNIYEVFIKNWRSVLFDTMAKSGLPKRFLSRQFCRDLKFSFRYLVKEKAVGIQFRTKPKWRYFKYSFRYAYGIFIIFPVLLMPKFMVRFFYFLYRKLKHKGEVQV